MCWTPLYTRNKTKTNTTNNTTQYVLDTTIYKKQDEDKYNKQYNTICVGHHYIQETRRRQIQQETQHNMCWTPLYTRNKTKTNTTRNTTQYVLDTTIYKKQDEDKHNTICVGHHYIQETRRRQIQQNTQHNMCWTPLYTRNKTKTNTTRNTTQYVLDTTIYKKQDEDKYNKKHNTICVGHHYIQETRRRQIQQTIQHNMCWTPLYTRNKTKTNTTRNTTQYVLDTTIYKKQDEDKYNKKHNTICVGHHYIQETRRRQIQQKTQHNMCWTPLYTRNKTKTNTTRNTTQYVLDTTIYKKQDEDKYNKQYNTICVGHHYIQETRRRQIQQETQHNMCWTPLYTRNKTKTNTTRNTTQYVLDTTIYKKQDEDKYNKKHNTICVGHHYIQETRRRQIQQNTQHNMCWTPLYTRNKTKTNTTRNTTQYVLDTTIYKKQDEDKYNKKHNTICVGHHYIQETRRRQIQQTIQHNMCWTPLYTRNKTKTNTTRNTTQYVLDTTIYKKQDEDKYNKNTTQYVLDTTIYKKQDEDKYNKTHNAICIGHHYIQETRRRQIQQNTQRNMYWTPLYTRNKTKTNTTKHTTQYVLDTTIYKKQDEDKYNKKHNTICVGHHYIQETRRRQIQQETQHNMCWTPLYTRNKTKTNTTNNTTQYVLDTTIYKKQDEDKYNKKHNTICVGHHYIQETRRRQIQQTHTTQYVLDTTIYKKQDEDKYNKKHNTICVGHHYIQETRRRQIQQETQHNMCWTPLYTRNKTKTNTTNNTTQYVLDTTIYKKQDEDKYNKQYNTICVGHHYIQETRRRQIQQETQHNMCWTPLYTRNKTKTNTTRNTTQYVLDTTIYKKQDEDKYNKKHNTICIGHHYIQETRRRQIQQTIQHNMYWTPLYTRNKTKTNTTNNTTQYVLDTTIYKKQDEDKYNKTHNTICVGHHYIQETRRRQIQQKHNTMCVGHHYIQETRRRQIQQKHNTICVGHHYIQETRRRQIQQNTQHNMCWTPLYTRNKTKTNTTRNTTQYVLDTTIYKKQDEDKHNKTHNTICVGHHYIQETRRRQIQQKHNTITQT